ncbi:MAG TPA: hypothetical protein VMI13_09115 [Solirubrobacteraceae bacterium]|nr:hypothetical protein [Solirubrobacteraceae bacterium]
MNDAITPPEAAYHLLLEPQEVAVTTSALHLLISDEAHQPDIRRLAREVLAGLEAEPDEFGVVTVALTPGQLKITHTAVHLLLDDLQREQADEMQILHGILDKLPDEHAIRAIRL